MRNQGLEKRGSSPKAQKVALVTIALAQAIVRKAMCVGLIVVARGLTCLKT
jgi:hypothetical protein